MPQRQVPFHFHYSVGPYSDAVRDPTQSFVLFTQSGYDLYGITFLYHIGGDAQIDTVETSVNV